jgi:folate-binding protein YgfZ
VLLCVAGRAAIEATFGSAPEPGRGRAGDDADVVATPDGRYLVDAREASAGAVRARLRADEGDASLWDWLGVRAGVPQITRATQDLFVPQTANFDLVGGIHFRKGCYPGQEIVARMQYLGRLKERLFAFHVDGAPPPAGSRVYGQPANEAVGTVVNAAPSPTGGSDLLAVVSWNAVEADPLRVGGPDGPVMAPLDLPYAVPKPVAPSRVKL